MLDKLMFVVQIIIGVVFINFGIVDRVTFSNWLGVRYPKLWWIRFEL